MKETISRRAIVGLLAVVAACDGTMECPDGFTNCGGYCIDTRTNFRHCGRCNTPCPSWEKACKEGTCVDFCGFVEVESESDLHGYLRGEGWDRIPGMNKYVRVLGDVTVSASSLGEGYVFMTEIPGISLSDAFVFGFDRSTNPTCETLLYPATGYRTALFSDVSFEISLQRYRGRERSTLSPQEATACSGPGGYCWVVANYIIPAAGECCCLDEPFDWTLVGFVPEKEGCSTQIECNGPFTGPHPSFCYDSYNDYISTFPSIAPECLTARGFVEEGKSCTCEVFDPDIGITVEGKCNRHGKCELDYDCQYPPVCRTEGERCVFG